VLLAVGLAQIPSKQLLDLLPEENVQISQGNAVICENQSLAHRTSNREADKKMIPK